MAQKQEIKTLEDAERIISEQKAHLYLISFIDVEGRPGSSVIGMAEDVPLYKPYFIFNEVNKEKHLITILNVIKLS